MLKEHVIPRLYQQTILGTCVTKNTLVVLPTGLGKTMIALLAAVARLREYPASKILFVSPTRPLVDQHTTTFTENLHTEPGKIISITGSVPAKKRQQLWNEAQFIFSTPQGLEHDLLARRIHLRDVSLFVFDEAHRAVGDYSYVYLAKQYLECAPNARVLALTASPGSDSETIMEVITNLGITGVEIRTPEDPDVKPYVQDTELTWIPVQLPEAFAVVKKNIELCVKNKLLQLKELGYLDRTSLRKIELLALQGQLQGRLAQGDNSMELLKSLSVLAEVLKAEHALELLESQGIGPLVTYLQKLQEQAQTGTTKAVKNLVVDTNFKTAYHHALALHAQKIEHPKLTLLSDLIHKIVIENHSEKTNSTLEQLDEADGATSSGQKSVARGEETGDARDGASPSTAKVIIFTQFRDSATTIKQTLDRLPHVKSEIFVGQAKKQGTGLSQKEQRAMLDKFRAGEFNVLIATSVAEEGLDIPKVDEVIFYEPIPSAIRSIQRRGRTGRSAKGSVKILMTKGTRDEAYRYSAQHKEKAMYRHLKTIGAQLAKQLMEKKMAEKETEETGDKTQQRLGAYTKDEQVTSMKFYVDQREKGSGLLKALIDADIGLELTNLPVGDYQLSTRICVEFKTTHDFIDSIIDGRLFDQLTELKRHFSRPLLIIEGEEDIYSIRNVHPNAIRGALASITTRLCMPVLQTRNSQETAAMLLSIGKKEQEETGNEFLPHGNKRPKTLKEKQEYLVGSLPGIGPKLAKPLLKEFKTIKGLVNADVETLQKIESIGKKKAEHLREMFEEEWKD